MAHHELAFNEKDRVRFDEIKAGNKTIETRAASERYAAIAQGDTVTFTCGNDQLTKRVAAVHHWPTVEAMLTEMPLSIIAPDLHTVEELKDRYATYPGYFERIAQGGLFGFALV